MHVEDRDRLKSELAEKEKEIAAKGGRLLRGEEWREYARARSHILTLTHTQPTPLKPFLHFCPFFLTMLQVQATDQREARPLRSI